MDKKDAERFRFLMSLEPEWLVIDSDGAGHYGVRIAFRSTKRYDSLVKMIDAGMIAYDRD